jgi:hypothetical protein
VSDRAVAREAALSAKGRRTERRVAVGQRVRRALGALLLPTLALGITVVALPGYVELAVHVWLLVVLGLGLLALIAALRETVPARPSGFEAALEPRVHPPARPPSLAKLEREVSMGAENAFDTHFRLRPLFTDLTRNLLLSRQGIDLDRQPERARELVGDELWELVRPDAQPPSERAAPGLPVETIERAADDLERLAWT